MAACLCTRARGMGSTAHAAQDLGSLATELAQDLRSLATELGLIVQELRRNIEASGRILRARGAAPRGKAASAAPRGKASDAPRGKAAGAHAAGAHAAGAHAAGARDETRRPFLGDETLRPFPLRASTDCAAQAQLCSAQSPARHGAAAATALDWNSSGLSTFIDNTRHIF
jgi:hypothetical protein